MLLTSILAIEELLRVKKRTVLENLFLITISISVLDISANYIFLDYLNKESYFNTLSKYYQYIFFLLEVSTIIYFYRKLFNTNKYYKYPIIIFIISFLINLLYFKLSKLNLNFFTYSLIIIFELILINFSFSRFFILNLEKEYSNEEKNLNYVNFGLFVFVNFTAPFYFISIYLAKINIEQIDLSFINYLGYTIFYSLIILSLKWKKSV